eukprot:4546183-Alexandrium_andersonii.AAC.1
MSAPLNVRLWIALECLGHPAGFGELRRAVEGLVNLTSSGWLWGRMLKSSGERWRPLEVLRSWDSLC